MLAVGPMRNATRTRWRKEQLGGLGRPHNNAACAFTMCDVQAEPPHSPHPWLGWAGLGW